MENKQPTLEEVTQGIQLMYDDDERDFMALALKGRTDIFTLLRNFFLQAPLTKKEEVAIKEFQSKKWLPLLKRVFFPEYDYKRGGQLFDTWGSMQVFGRDPADVAFETEARMIFSNYLKERFECLSGGKNGKIKIVDLLPNQLKSNERNLVDLMARSLIVRGIHGSVFQLQILSQARQETPEEAKARLEKDSTK